MLDTHQLEIFLTAAELENFSEAARQLHLSQPSVSAHVQALEKKLDISLFSRSGPRISLTDAGHTLLPLARQIVQLSIHTEETMSSLKGQVTGHLKLGCSTTSGKYILPRLLARFCEQYPHIQMSCFVTDRQVVMDSIRDGTVHLGVTSARPFDKDIEFRHFTSDNVILIAPIDHPWASREHVQPRELLSERFILREEKSGTRRVLEEGLAEHDIHLNQFQVAMVMGNSEAIRTMVEEGFALAFVSRMVAQAGIDLGRLAKIRVEGLDLYQQLFIGRNIRRPSSKAQTTFWEFFDKPEHRALLHLSK